MTGERRDRGRRRRERVEGNAFMDVVRDGFVRWMALEKWREIEDLRSAAGLSGPEAVVEAGRFPERGPYASLWATRWREEVRLAATGGEPGGLFAAVERAVRAAVADEEAARKARGDRPLDEDPGYRAFVDGALESLLRQAAAPPEGA